MINVNVNVNANVKKIEIRQARPEELPWINARYDEVKFIHSDLSREFVAIAEVDGIKAGLGRFVKLDDVHAELGGMFVLESFRGFGLADKIVRYLLEQNQKHAKVYCLPFAHLAHFYQRFGFDTCTDLAMVPEEIIKKHAWCNREYDKPLLLFILAEKVRA